MCLTVRPTTRPYRKAMLLPSVRSKTARLRVAGSKGDWTLCVQRGRTLFALRHGFKTPNAATAFAAERYGLKATRLSPSEVKGSVSTGPETVVLAG